MGREEGEERKLACSTMPLYDVPVHCTLLPSAASPVKRSLCLCPT